MPIEISMPKLGESVTEGTLARWLVGPGDTVRKFDSLCEVVTDKVTAEVPAPEAGTVLELLAAEGDTVAVGTVIARLSEGEAGTAEPPPPVAAPVAEPAAASPAGEVKILPQRYDAEGRPLLSPAVRRAAAERGIDPARVPGTGAGGRVTLQDVLSAPAPPPADAGREAPPPAVAAAPAAEYEEIVPDPVRRTIAERMSRSVREIPHAWSMVEVDATRLVERHRALREEFARREGFNLTYLPFFIKAVVEALAAHRILNASWKDGKIRIYRRIHVGVAVGLEDGLVVPVIHDTDRLSVAGIARRLHDLVGRARTGRLRVEDVEGATITVNNTGALGTVLSAPIIRPPQAAIVTLEQVKRRPVAVGDAIGLRWMVNVCLSFDHRVTDGIPATRFLAELKRRIEELPEDASIY